MQGLGERANEQRLGQAGDAFQQRVPLGEDRHENLFDDFVLADDDFGQLVADAVVGLFAALDRRDIVGGNGDGFWGGGGGGHKWLRVSDILVSGELLASRQRKRPEFLKSRKRELFKFPV